MLPVQLFFKVFLRDLLWDAIENFLLAFSLVFVDIILYYFIQFQVNFGTFLSSTVTFDLEHDFIFDYF